MHVDEIFRYFLLTCAVNGVRATFADDDAGV